MVGKPKIATKQRGQMDAMVHTPMPSELKEKLESMAHEDGFARTTDFVRRLIKQEWDRRHAAAAPAA
jgi:hypothetical protein